jgi:exopolysaccharide production protein ExoZ
MIQSKGKMLLIQTFRGIAALFVLFHHSTSLMADKRLGVLNNIFSVGWVGVDFFFVLSGFIIFYIHFKDIGEKEKLGRFCLKRFIRVYPVYWIVTIASMILFLYVPIVGRTHTVKEIIKSFLLFPQTQQPIVNVGWSLSYEVFFYFIFSLLIFLKPRYSIPIVSIWITGILLNSFGLIMTDNSRFNFYFNFIFSHYDIEFILGCGVAYITLKTKVKYSIPLMIIGLFSFLLGWWMVMNGNILRASNMSMLVFGVSCSLLVLSAASIDLDKKPKIPKLFHLIGDASFSIYLTHIYFIRLLKNTGYFDTFNPFITLFLLSLITVLLGIAFHKIIEKPVLNYVNQLFLRKPNNIQILRGKVS